MYKYDIGIIGGGPAGLTAAIYCLRDNKSIILFDKNYELGGQILNSNGVENIPGFLKISGAEFISNLENQIAKAEEAGKGFFNLKLETEIVDIQKGDDGLFVLTDNGGAKYFVKRVIIASGSEYRKLGVPGEEDFIGRGISFCSTCDAPFCKDKNVAVIGGGNSALTEALEVAEYAKSVTILQNLPGLTAEKSLCEKVENHPKITIQFNITITEFYKHKDAVGVHISYTYQANGNPTYEEFRSYDNVFIAVGMQASNDFAKNVCVCDSNGYITGSYFEEEVLPAGDCKHKLVKQVATACGDGAEVAVALCKTL